MNKSLLIFKHELISTIRRPGFIILTLALPIIALVGMRIIHSTSKSTQQATSITKIGYVDQIGEFSKFTKEGSVTFIPYKTVSEATKSLVNGDIEEYIVIPQNYITTGKIESFAINVGTRVSSTSQEEITKFLSVNLLIGKVPPIIIERVETPPNISSTTLTSSSSFKHRFNTIPLNTDDAMSVVSPHQ
jgi:ABC-2 type transport system permease protein